MRRSLLLLSAIFFCAIVVAGDRVAKAQQAPVINLEYQRKAGYFAYFGLYISWPQPPGAAANKPFVIGILGDNPFRRNLVAGQNGFLIKAGTVRVGQIQGRKITVVHYRSVAEFNRNYKPCQVLFICRSSHPGVQGETPTDRVNAAITKTKGQPVLLVGEGTSMAESQRFANAGVLICYWNDVGTRRVKMFINWTVAKREKFAIGAPLLGLKVVTVL